MMFGLAVVDSWAPSRGCLWTVFLLFSLYRFESISSAHLCRWSICRWGPLHEWLVNCLRQTGGVELTFEAGGVELTF